jgi:hypothetical protein
LDFLKFSDRDNADTTSKTPLPSRALIVQILLKLNRPDLAINELGAMQQINDLAVPTLLAQAWVGLAVVRGIFEPQLLWSLLPFTDYLFC